ncbi:MAG: hypothetical protein V7606_3510 [Burkholderiales bacterium]|jgi:hypothetical protein|nr:hypothetical protein [Burkholderia sp.]
MDIPRFPIHQFSIHQSADGSYEIVRAFYDDEAGLDTRYRVVGGLTQDEAEETLLQITSGKYDVPGPDDFEE